MLSNYAPYVFAKYEINISYFVILFLTKQVPKLVENIYSPGNKIRLR